MGFESFYGNKDLKENISKTIAEGVFPHAAVLEGEKGTGKKTLARLIAAALLCRSENRPCCECAVCRNVLNCNHADVLYYESNKHVRDTFTIFTVREIREKVFEMPSQSDNKIFILGEADFMNPAAQNALLKVLEEPPKYAYFILLCERKSSLLETILSRSRVYTLNRVSDEEACEYVLSHIHGPTRQETEKAVALIGGNIGKVISGLHGSDVVRGNEKAIEIARATAADNEFELLGALADFDGSKTLILSTVSPLRMMFRDALAYRCGGKIIISENEATAKLVASRLTKAQILALLQVTEELKKRTDENMNNKLLITWLCASLRSAAEL